MWCMEVQITKESRLYLEIHSPCLTRKVEKRASKQHELLSR